MFPRKEFLMGSIRKLQKHKESDRSGNFLKTRRKEWRKEKEEIFFEKTYVEVPILVCFPSVRNTFKLSPLCDPPSGKPTHMGTSLTTYCIWECTYKCTRKCCEGFFMLTSDLEIFDLDLLYTSS
jgi:hypothetical protein